MPPGCRPVNARPGRPPRPPGSRSASSVGVPAGAQGRTLGELLDVLGAGCRDNLVVDVGSMVEQAIPLAGRAAAAARILRVWAVARHRNHATRTLKPGYRDVAAASFRSVVRAVDFINKPEQAVKQINNWVAASTNNLIHSIVDSSSVNGSTSLMVTNAIYFKGVWQTPFKRLWTEKGKFHSLDGASRSADCRAACRRPRRA